MPCSSQIIQEMLPEVPTMEKCYFLNPMINFQIIKFSVLQRSVDLRITKRFPSKKGEFYISLS